MNFSNEQLVLIIIILWVTYFLLKFMQPKKSKKVDPLDKVNITLKDIHREIVEIKSNSILNRDK